MKYETGQRDTGRAWLGQWVVGVALLQQPQTPFVALHAALAHAAAHDLSALGDLTRHCRTSSSATMRAAVAAVCAALLAMGGGALVGSRHPRTLIDVQPVLARAGGSAAQREIVEETLLYCLVRDGQADEARNVLDGRLGRRSSPLDLGRCRSLQAAPVLA